MKAHYQILIIGGGTGGIMTAAQLLRKNKNLKIGLIEPSDKHYYQPAWTLVGAGDYSFDKTVRKEADQIPKGTDWIKDWAVKLDPDQNSVETKSGNTYTYEFLVVSPGLKMDLDALPGLRETIGKNGVCSNYIDPEYTWKALREFKGGQAVFTQVHAPIKCGGAPQKIMYLADEHFRKSGVREKTNVVYATPGSVVFGVSPYKETIDNVVQRKEIATRFFYELIKIDGQKKEAHYRPLKPAGEMPGFPKQPEVTERINEDGTIIVPFDFLHLAPPQSPPEFVQESPLAVKEGAGKGYLDVDIHSLQSNRYANVFGIGDSANLPTAKTGAAIRKQVPVVVENILRLLESKPLSDMRYEGYSSCPLITGYGKMVLAEFKYNNERDSDPILSKLVDTSKEKWSMWLLKKYGLPFLYWNFMMKGKM